MGKKVLTVALNELLRLGPDTDSNDWPIRNEVLYKQNNPTLWSEICQEALMHNRVQDPVVRIWLRIEEVNGLRRQSGLWQNVAKEKLGFIRKLIDELGFDHPRRARLLGLWAYHGAMVFHIAGEFSKAACCHQEEEALAELAKDGWHQAVAHFCWAIENANAAVVAGEFSHEDVTSVIEACLRVVAIADKTSTECIRWQANVYCHMVFWSWFGGSKTLVTVLPKWVDFLESLPSDIVPVFAHALPVVRAISSYYSGDYIGAVNLTNDLAIKADPDWYERALVVRLFSLKQIGDQTKVVAVLNEISELDTGHLAKVIAL